MYSLAFHPEAVAELKALKTTDPVAWARLVTVFAEWKADHGLLDRLSQHGYGADQRAAFDVSRWIALWNEGLNVWRVKLWSLERQGLQYRVIYVFQPVEQRYYVCAIAPRGWNYDEQHPISQRVRALARELDGRG